MGGEGKIKSIAIMGGTFDPIHYGHLVTAEAVRNVIKVDKVIFIPAGRPAHKINENVTFDLHRYVMTLLATAENEFFEVSRIELDREGTSYTIDTILELKKLYGEKTKLFFIMGADAMHEITSWKSYDVLLTLCDFVAVTRPGYKKKELIKKVALIREKYKSKIHYLEVPALEISSSEIRSRVKNGRPIRYLLPESVEEYINKSGLYNEKGLDGEKCMEIDMIKIKLQSALGVNRYIHTLGVMDEAVRLAEIYGDESLIDKARTAALLHDCAKDFPNDLKLRLCKEFHLAIDEIMKKQPDLTHPLLGAEVAKREYMVTDEEILEAIRCHTTGKAGMSLLDKIIYAADYIEPNRDRFDGVDEARALANTDLDKAMLFMLNKTVFYVNEKKRTLHPQTEIALKYFEVL